MIVDSLENGKTYESIHPKFAEAFAFLAECVKAPKPAGHYELDGDSLFVNIFELEPAESAEPRFEAHEKYIDIQCVLAGSEYQYCAPKAGLEDAVPYDDARDIAFYRFDGSGTKIALGERMFAIYFPQDGHLPSVPDGVAKKVVRAVAKVKV